MMSSSAYAIQDIELVRIKLWRNRNVMLMNKLQPFAASPTSTRERVIDAQDIQCRS